MRAVLIFSCAALLLGGGLALAAPASLASFADQIDVIGLSRAADALGDAQLERALVAVEHREAALVAVRAAAFAEAPERLVPKLVAVSCGRDPALAPEAGLTLYTLAERVTQQSLATREVLLSDVKLAIDSLQAGCALEPRADIAVAIATLHATLVGLQ